MGSSDEEKLIQMVTDFIESEPNQPNSSPLSDSQNFFSKPSHPTLQDVLEIVTDDEALILGKILVYSKRNNEISEKNNHLKKRIFWELKRDGFEASICTTSWVVATFGRPSAFEFRSNYEYIDVMMKNKNNVEDDDIPTRLIVDIDFRSQFEIIRPTQTYSELLNNLPRIFVGTEKKLMKIISIICSAAKKSLRERGLHIPPWSKASYMQSKWLSKDCKKISISSAKFL